MASILLTERDIVTAGRQINGVAYWKADITELFQIHAPWSPWSTFEEFEKAVELQKHMPHKQVPTNYEELRRGLARCLGIAGKDKEMFAPPLATAKIIERWVKYSEGSKVKNSRAMSYPGMRHAFRIMEGADDAEILCLKHGFVLPEAQRPPAPPALQQSTVDAIVRTCEQSARKMEARTKALERRQARTEAQVNDIFTEMRSPERAPGTARAVRMAALPDSAPPSPSSAASSFASRLDEPARQLGSSRDVEQDPFAYDAQPAFKSTPRPGRSFIGSPPPRARASRLRAADFAVQSLAPADEGDREVDEAEELLEGGAYTASAAADEEAVRHSFGVLTFGAESAMPIAGPSSSSSSSSSSSKVAKTAVLKKGVQQKQAKHDVPSSPPPARRSSRVPAGRSTSGIVKPPAHDLACSTFGNPSTVGLRPPAVSTTSARPASSSASARPLARHIPKKLAPEDDARYKAILNTPGYESTVPGAAASRKDLKLLKSGSWLNDELVNFIGVLVNMRNDEADKHEAAGSSRGAGETQLRKAFVFNTNFFSFYSDSGFAKVKKWTRRFDTFEKDILIVPIISNSHWSCAAINLKLKRFEHYDSFGKPDAAVYECLRKWLVEEHRNRKQSEIDLSDWEDYCHEDVPQQQNASDCGVFTCMFMESLSRDVNFFDFSQQNMPYLRKKMVLQIDKRDLLDDEPWPWV